MNRYSSTRGVLCPQAMAGTLTIVHIANLPAFQGRSIYFGPDDLKNLYVSFPGKADSTVTERIAFTLAEEIMPLSDYLIDIHSGDGNESLRPSYSAYYADAGGSVPAPCGGGVWSGDNSAVCRVLQQSR